MHQAVAFGRVNPGKADVRFLCYILQVLEILSPFIELKAGGTIQNLNLEQVRSIEIPLPPLSKQKRIASKIQELTEDVEGARNACEKQFEAAKALPAAYLRQIFESEETKKFERKRLGEVCEIVKGKKPNFYKNDDTKNLLPYLTAEILRGYADPMWCSKTDSNSVVINEDEIIIITDGSNSCEVFIGHNGVLASTMGKLRIYNEKVIPDYLYFFIKMHFKELNTPKRGSAITHLEKGFFYNLLILLLPI